MQTSLRYHQPAHGMLRPSVSETIALTYDDIIFLGFQRAYSAFNLRQQYRPTLSHALGLGVGLFLLMLSGFAQTPASFNPEVFTVVEKQPEFPGGFNALKDYMQTTVQYPAEAQKAGIKGRVFVNFIVEPNGALTDIQLLQGLGYGCDEEALRVVKAMPCWLPGGQSGRPLRVRYTLPVLFGVGYPKVKAR